MEKLLQYIWKHKIFPLHKLQTDQGNEIEVLDPGLQNTDAGPDFFNAKIKCGNTVWVGNVEVHLQASEWYHHGHHQDPTYNNVILHVVTVADCVVETADGKKIPQLILPVSEKMYQKYEQFKINEHKPRCYTILPHLSTFFIHNWMNALVYERLEMRSLQVKQRLEHLNGDWETTFFITLSRNLGFGLNGDAFEQWAQKVPLQAAAKHRDNLLQIEALFLGIAGLLQPDEMDREEKERALADPYFQQLSREYAYLKHKFELQELPSSLWKYMRTRPYNFPHLRLSQLARMYHEEKLNFSIIRDLSDATLLKQRLQMETSPYWEDHYLFGYPSVHSNKKLGQTAIDLLMINTIVPTLFAYGNYIGKEEYIEQAAALLENIKPENNHIIRMWQECGLKVEHAADSQALIQLKKEYCDKHECLRCRFGYEFLKQAQKACLSEGNKSVEEP